VHIPDELLAQAKLKAAKDGRTLTSLIEEGLRLVVLTSNRKSVDNGPSTPMPISQRRWEPHTGFDPTKLATELQELDDIERYGRSASDT